MAGIYFHIPFCKGKCNYCNFYSITNLSAIEQLINSEIRELILRKEYLDNEIIETIYFGGGTPSLLSGLQIVILLENIRNNYIVSNKSEITIEVNPDDLTEEYLTLLFNAGINRLSIGVQSFDDTILEFLGRRHDSSRLVSSINCAKNIGFDNISIDVIFGVPGMNINNYLKTLEEIIKLDIQHISAYSLTIEKHTNFHKLLKYNQIKILDEEDVLKQYEYTIDILKENGYFQYEISNFAKEGYKSLHNSSYWKSIKYIGIGPSAHSYNGISRQWNVRNVIKYCQRIEQSEVFYKEEFLTERDKYNEQLLTRLRTSEGISGSYICNSFGQNIVKHFLSGISKLERDEFIIQKENIFFLTRKGILMTDFAIRLLFYN